MPASQTLTSFALAALVLIAVPGASVLFVVARTVEHGRRAGLVSVLGLEAGTLVHVGVAAAGLSALLAASATALTGLELAGAAYLVWLGLRALRPPGRQAPQGPGPDGHPHPAAPRRLFRDALAIEGLNPKTALFFIAFLPHYLKPGHGPVWTQVLVLGGCFVAVAVLVDSAWALLAGRWRAHLGGALIRRLSGGTYLLLATATAGSMAVAA